MTIAWSYSTLLDFEACPYRVKLKKVDKIDDGLDDNPILKDGKEKHELLENYVLDLKAGKEPEFPECANKIKEKILEIIDQYGIENVTPEQKMSFDKDFTPLKGKDFWYSPNVWLRAVVDLIAHDGRQATVVDYKSGKHNPYASFRNIGQLQLYAVIAFLVYPEITTVSTYLMYMKDGKKTNKIYYRSKLPEYMEMFAERGNKVFLAETFPAKPSNSNCKYCGYKEEICEYAGD